MLFASGLVPSFLSIAPMLPDRSTPSQVWQLERAEGSLSAKSSRQVRQVRSTPKGRFAPSCPVRSVVCFDGSGAGPRDLGGHSNPMSRPTSRRRRSSKPRTALPRGGSARNDWQCLRMCLNVSPATAGRGKRILAGRQPPTRWCWEGVALSRLLLWTRVGQK